MLLRVANKHRKARAFKRRDYLSRGCCNPLSPGYERAPWKGFPAVRLYPPQSPADPRWDPDGLPFW